MKNLNQFLSRAALLGISAAFGLSITTRVTAQEVVAVYIFEGQQFTQTTAGSVSPASGNAFEFRSQALASSKSFLTVPPTIKAPGASSANNMTTTDDVADVYYRYDVAVASQSALTTAFPSGAYTVAYTGQFSGAASKQITFPAGSIPSAPVIANFTAAQSIDPDTDFDLQWTVANASASDMIEVTIRDGQGNVVLASDPVAPSGTLAGAETVYTIPGGTLLTGGSYTATITYYKVTGQTLTSIPISLTAFFAQTTATIRAQGSAPVDTTPPTLLEAQPADGFLLPITNYFSFPATFRFSESMTAADVAIGWSGNIDATKVHYQWVADGASPNVVLLATCTGGWPANAHITWTLNPDSAGVSNLRDLAGNLLAANTYKGGFLTGPGDSDNICVGADTVLGASFGIIKSLRNYQNSAGDVHPAADSVATFKAFFNPAGSQIATSAMLLQMPLLHRDATLAFSTNLTDNIQVFADMQPSQSALDTAYPVTSYQLSQIGTAGIQNSVQLSVATGNYPPAPKFLNVPQAAPDFAHDVTVTWTPFADEAQNGLTVFEVLDEKTNVVFRLPDACNGRALAPGSGSAVIPARTLGSASNPDAKYSLRLTFYRFSDQGKTFPGVAGKGFAALAQTTAASLTPIDDVVQTTPADLHKITSIKPAGSSFDMQFTGWISSNYVLEATASLTPPVEWNQVQAVQATSQSFKLSDVSWLNNPRRFYRVRMVDGALPTLVTNGIAVLDTSRTIASPLDDAGGSLSITNVDGDIYTFQVDTNSMGSYEDVNMTLVTKLTTFPLSGGLVAGVYITPADVPLVPSGTLTVQFALPPPANLAAATFDASAGAFLLTPIFVNGNTATVSLNHLGGVALGVWNPADATYFNANGATGANAIVQNLALAQLPQAASAGGKKASTAAATDWQLELQLQYSELRFLLLATEGTTDYNALLYALDTIQTWNQLVVNKNLAATFADQIAFVNGEARTLINNRATQLFDQAAQHDFNAMQWLLELKNLVNKEPWGHTWVPGTGSDIIERINNIMHFSLDFHSVVDWSTTAGPVHSKVQSTIDYDSKAFPFKGSSQITWVEHSHYQPPSPCTVTPGPAPGNVVALDLAFKVKRPQNANDKFVLQDIRYVFWPDVVSENDLIQCPPAASLTLKYWYPTFGTDHEKLFFTFRNSFFLHAGIDIKGDWAVSQSGSAQMGVRIDTKSNSYSDANTTENTEFILRHTPQ